MADPTASNMPSGDQARRDNCTGWGVTGVEVGSGKEEGDGVGVPDGEGDVDATRSVTAICVAVGVTGTEGVVDTVCGLRAAGALAVGPANCQRISKTPATMMIATETSTGANQGAALPRRGVADRIDCPHR